MALSFWGPEKVLELERCWGRWVGPSSGLGGPLRAWIGDGDRPGLDLGRVGAWVLVGWPRSLHRLSGDLQVVDELRPRPHRGALAGLGGVLDDFVQPGVPGTVAGGLDRQRDPLPSVPEVTDVTGDHGAGICPPPQWSVVVARAATVPLGLTRPRRGWCTTAPQSATATRRPVSN